MINDIKKPFENYRETVHQVQTDLQFWKSFVKRGISEYQKTTSENREIFTSGFLVYDFAQCNGTARMHKKTMNIETDDLENQLTNFFARIQNLVIVKVYNAVEILLIEAIRLKSFPLEQSVLRKKKNANKIHQNIKEYLTTNKINYDTTNNRHIIALIEANSIEASEFLNCPLPDLKTTFKKYFELVSVLRNIIAHHGGILNNDTINQINSVGADIFQRVFRIHVENDMKTLMPLESNFGQLINLINDFAVNTVKFLYSEKDLSFLGLH